MGLIRVKISAMVLIYCPKRSTWHARCHKNPLATYWSLLGGDSTHLRNGPLQKWLFFSFLCFMTLAASNEPQMERYGPGLLEVMCQAMSGDDFGLWGQRPRYSCFGAILKSLKNAQFSLKLKYLRYRELPIGHFLCGQYHTPGLLGAKKSGG